MFDLHVHVEPCSGIDLLKCGAYAYARHKTTKCPVLAYAIEEEEVKRWLPGSETMPDDLKSALCDENCLLRAWNSEFERLLLKHVLHIDIPLPRWRCTMTQALAVSLPASLEGSAEALNAEVKKDKYGKRLISLFSKPSRLKEREGDFERFVRYCMQRVKTERALHHRLPPLSDTLLEEFQLSCRSNEYGLPVNLEFLCNLKTMTLVRKDYLLQELERVTGLDNANSPAQLKKWLKDVHGMEVQSLRSDALKRLLGQKDLAPEVATVLQMRQEAAKISTAKLETMERAVCTGRLKGCFQFLGAGRTGRDAGRVFQPQNLPRGILSKGRVTALTQEINAGNTDSLTMYEISSLIRSAIQPPADKTLVVCDLSSIESRVAAWLSDCCRMQSILKSGLDLYKDFAARLFSVSYDAVTKEQRALAKPAVLGCMYGLGAGAVVKTEAGDVKTGLVNYAQVFNVNLSEEEALAHVRTFRGSYSEVQNAWLELESAAKRAISLGENRTLFYGKLTIERVNDCMAIRLPSASRKIYYHKPSVTEETTHWGAKRAAINYYGVGRTRKWEALNTYGAKIFENVVQAIARDILYHGFREADKAGLKVIGRVHDELIAECDKTDSIEVENTLKACMCRVPHWAEGLILDAEAFTSDFYRK